MIKNFTNLVFDTIDENIAKISILFGGFFVLFGFLLQSELFSKAVIILGISIILFSFLYLYKIKPNFPRDLTFFLHARENHGKKYFIVLLTANVLLLILLVLSTYYSTTPRGTFFLLILAGICFSLALQILSISSSLKFQTTVVIIEVLVVGLLIRASLFYQFPGFIGDDPWAHTWFISIIKNFGYIPPYDQSAFHYSYFPLMHLLCVSASAMLMLDIKNSLFLMIGFFEVISVIFIFLICRKYFDVRIGLFSILIILISPYHVLNGYRIIAMTLGLGLIVLCVYLLMCIIDSQKKNIEIILLFIISFFAIICTHVIPTVIVCLVIFMILISTYALKFSNYGKFSQQKINFLFFAFCASLAIVYYIYYAHFSSIPINASISGFSTQKQTVLAANFFQAFLDQFSIILFFIFSYIGLLYLLAKENLSNITFSYVFLSGSIGIFNFIALLLFPSLFPERWLAFSFIFLSIPCVIGLFLISSLFKTQIGRVLSILVIFGTFLFLLLNNSSIDITKVDPIKNSVTDSEIQSVYTITNNIGRSEKIGTSQNFKNIANVYLSKEQSNRIINIWSLLEEGKYNSMHVEFILTSKRYVKGSNYENDFTKNKFQLIYDSNEVNGYSISR